MIREQYVLTIGYLVMEAEAVEVKAASGRTVPATLAAFDHASGFGLLRLMAPLGGTPLPLGDLFSTEVLRGGSAGFGLLVSGLGFGMAAGVLLLSALQRRLPKAQIFTLAVLGAGLFLFARAPVGGDYWIDVFPGMVLLGFGAGLVLLLPVAFLTARRWLRKEDGAGDALAGAFVLAVSLLSYLVSRLAVLTALLLPVAGALWLRRRLAPRICFAAMAALLIVQAGVFVSFARQLARDDALHLAELLHQVRLGVEPAGGIDEQEIHTPRLGRLQRVEDYGGWIAPWLMGDDLCAGPFPPDLELLDGGRPKGVTRRQQDPLPLAGRPMCELSDRRGLSHPVHPCRQHHMRTARGGGCLRDREEEGNLLLQEAE